MCLTVDATDTGPVSCDEIELTIPPRHDHENRERQKTNFSQNRRTLNNLAQQENHTLGLEMSLKETITQTNQRQNTLWEESCDKNQFANSHTWSTRQPQATRRKAR